MRARSVSARGVTLVEVLVAVAVLSIALTGIFRALDAQTLNTAGMTERSLAHWAALNAIEEARFAGPPAEAETIDQVRMGPIDWRVALIREEGPFGLIRLEARAGAEGRAGAVVTGFLTPDDRP